MPRQAREISPTGYYHIMMRGINKDYIYQSIQDRVGQAMCFRTATAAKWSRTKGT